MRTKDQKYTFLDEDWAQAFANPEREDGMLCYYWKVVGSAVPHEVMESFEAVDFMTAVTTRKNEGLILELVVYNTESRGSEIYHQSFHPVRFDDMRVSTALNYLDRTVGCEEGKTRLDRSMGG